MKISENGRKNLMRSWMTPKNLMLTLISLRKIQQKIREAKRCLSWIVSRKNSEMYFNRLVNIKAILRNMKEIKSKGRKNWKKNKKKKRILRITKIRSQIQMNRPRSLDITYRNFKRFLKSLRAQSRKLI